MHGYGQGYGVGSLSAASPPTVDATLRRGGYRRQYMEAFCSGTAGPATTSEPVEVLAAAGEQG
jgi:hypothetical protein